MLGAVDPMAVRTLGACSQSFLNYVLQKVIEIVRDEFHNNLLVRFYEKVFNKIFFTVFCRYQFSKKLCNE